MRLAIALLVLAGTVSAQGRVHARHTIPSKPTIWRTDEDPGFWAATFNGQPSANQVLGGSNFTNTTSMLTRSNTSINNALTILNTSSQFTPENIVVEERKANNQFTYHGLSATGRWIPLNLNSKATLTNFNSEQLVVVFQTTAAGTTMHLFQPWNSKWNSFPLGNNVTPNNVFINDTTVVVFTGSALVAYSAFDPKPRLLATNFNGTTLKTATSVVSTRTSGAMGHAQVWITGTNEFSIFSAWTNTWIKMNTGSTAAANINVEYDDRVCVFADGNKLTFYSAMNHFMATAIVTDLTKVVRQRDTMEDSGVTFQDPGNGNLIIFGASGQLIQRRAPTLTFGSDLLFDNEVVAFKDGSRYFATSYNVTSGLQSIDIGSETQVAFLRSDDAIFVVTDKAAYAFSGITNTWSRQAYTGKLNRRTLIDHVVWFEADNTVYAFSGRANVWASLKVGTNYSFFQEDGVLVIVDGTKRSGFGRESTAFKTVDLGSAPTLDMLSANLDGKESHYWAITKEGNNSKIWYYTAIADEWETATTSATITRNDITGFDEAILVATNTKLITFTAWPQLNTQLTWPYNNRRYPPFSGTPARFVARGPANQPLLLLVGQRVPATTLAGFGGSLNVNLAAPFLIFNLGTFSANGTAEFSFTLPRQTLTLGGQWVSNVNGRPTFGQALTFIQHN